MAVVMVLFVCMEVFGTMAAQLGMGVDIWTVECSTMTLTLMFLYIAESFYLAILALTKISVLCFYLRIFQHQRQILQCVPVAFVWEGWKKGPFGPHHCLNVNMLTYWSAGTSIAQDAAILALPLPAVARLNMPLRSKLGACFMFSLGIFVLIASCARLRSIHLFGDSPNPTWDYTDAVIWTGLEVAVSIVVSSMPAMRVLAGRWWAMRSRKRTKRTQRRGVYGKNTDALSLGVSTAGMDRERTRLGGNTGVQT
ncbi:hypothetical protein VTK26DRAFT_1395 [Humicola hyalothermophila]